MKILKETEETKILLDCEFQEEEIDILLNYAIKNLSKEQIKNSLIEWAFVDIITKQVNKKGKSKKVKK